MRHGTSQRRKDPTEGEAVEPIGWWDWGVAGAAAVLAVAWLGRLLRARRRAILADLQREAAARRKPPPEKP